MQDRWNHVPSPATTGALAECVHGSRLLGADPDLVLHGGGNTSVKAPWRDVTGREVDALYVKGSGWDLATIEAAGFAPLPIDRLHELLALEELSDADMMSALSAARLDPAAPQPSVESLLHALLPHTAVQHSHADVIVTLTNLADGEARVREVLGSRVLVVPYVMPGFDLAREVRARWAVEGHEDLDGLLLMNHGLFTFADTTRHAYRLHVELITAAEEWLDRHAPRALEPGPALPPAEPADLAEIRRQVSVAAGRAMVVTRHTDPDSARFVRRPDLASLSRRGPLTPDHVIRTKALPLVGRDVEGYAAGYREHYAAHEHRGRTPLTMLDPAPRVVLDVDLGLLTVGRTPAESGIVADIYRHTMAVLERSEDHLGGYRALPAADLFDVEYWDLEQAKLRRAGEPPPLAGQVAVVTGAASGIGRACAAELLGAGAAVIGLDRSPEVARALAGPGWLGLEADVTDAGAVTAAIGTGVERFGGVDLAVIAAGIFGASAAVAELDPAEWRRVMDVNLDSVVGLLGRLHPLLTRSPVDARVVIVGSKNVAAPGRGAAAYSASKAALTQLARVTALEWADDGIRVNTVHPDAVFDTGLWTADLLAERAARYGLTVEEYRRRNLLRTEVTSAQVARLVAALCGPAFAATTGAQIPVDGGNERTL